MTTLANASRGRRSGRGGLNPQRTMVYTLLVLGAALFAMPLIIMITTSFKSYTEINSFPPTIIPHAWLPQNYPQAWGYQNTDFPKWTLNTLIILGCTLPGVLLTSSMCAYGFARLRFPGRNIFFFILLGTIILPNQVTLLPQYVIFTWLGWNGTWLPLIVPHFFANAFNVFLLRQYFMTIPRDLDEAAMIDGAGPFRILRTIIVPQSIPAITAVTLFHFFFAWNDFFVPLLYLAGKPEIQPVSIALQQYNALYATQPTLIQASALMTMVVPIVVFLLAQKAFMRGVVITGVDK